MAADKLQESYESLVKDRTDFAERRILMNEITERLFESDLEDEAMPYRDTPAFEEDWGSGARMSAPTLLNKMDDHINTLCTKVPEVAELMKRVGEALTPVQLFKLLKKHEFELDAAEAAVGEAVSAANKAAPPVPAWKRKMKRWWAEVVKE